MPCKTNLWHRLATATALYYITFLPVLAGVWFGVDYLVPRDYHDFPGYAISQPPGNLLNGFANWDGVWYGDIVENGYSLHEGQGSNVVFFPAYPVAAGCVQWVTRLPTNWSLLIVSHAALIAAIMLLAEYLRLRCDGISDDDTDLFCIGLLALPMTFFFRMAYAESLFLMCVLLMLYGMGRKWPVWSLALVVGFATGVRAVGVALLPVWWVYVWMSDVRAISLGARVSRFLVRSLVLTPLACWGLLSFMAWLWHHFDDPFLFATHHAAYNVRTETALLDRIWNLVRLEPVWSVYLPGHSAYWMLDEPVQNPLFSLRFLNPLTFVGACGLLALGAWKRWLNLREILLGGLLVLIPYATKGHDNAMLGMSRYCIVAVPVYIVFGRVLLRTPDGLRTMLLMSFCCLLTLFSSLFAAWFVWV